MPKQPEYPTILTNSDWQKHKGIIAKFVTRGEGTGIGDKLDKIKDAFGKIKWDKFNATVATNTESKVKTPEGVRGKWEEAKAEYKNTVAPVVTMLNELRELCGRVAKEFQENNKIPSSSRKHVEDIAEKAKEFSLLLKDNSSHFAAVKKEFDDREAFFAEALKTIAASAKSYSTKVQAKAKTVLELLAKQDAKPAEKLSAFSNFRTEEIRGLSAALGRHPVPEISNWNKDKFVKFTYDSYDPKKPEDIPGKLKEVLAAVKELEPMLK